MGARKYVVEVEVWPEDASYPEHIFDEYEVPLPPEPDEMEFLQQISSAVGHFYPKCVIAAKFLK
jgi:hypothetical protein